MAAAAVVDVVTDAAWACCALAAPACISVAAAAAAPVDARIDAAWVRALAVPAPAPVALAARAEEVALELTVPKMDWESAAGKGVVLDANTWAATFAAWYARHTR